MSCNCVYQWVYSHEVMDAVKTMEPLILSEMNLRAAAVAQANAPNTFSLNSCSTCSMVKSSAGWCFVMPAYPKSASRSNQDYGFQD